jgi:hypothetical protein
VLHHKRLAHCGNCVLLVVSAPPRFGGSLVPRVAQWVSSAIQRTLCHEHMHCLQQLLRTAGFATHFKASYGPKMQGLPSPTCRL